MNDKNSSIKKALSLVLSLIFMLTAVSIGAVQSAFAEAGAVVINEICSSNGGTDGNITSVVNEDGTYCDWVELYNTSDEAVDISGWGISDGAKNFYKFAFPEGTTIGAKEYLVVYCSKTFAAGQSGFVAPIGISSDGETIRFTSPDASLQDIMEIPALTTDTTYGRLPDGTGELTVMRPTPNADNAKLDLKPQNPVFSAESGMYKEGFDLAITAENSEKIYYTLDGSDPQSSDTRIEYTEPIDVHDRTGEKNVLSAVPSEKICIGANGPVPSDSAVDKATVIRACSADADGIYSGTVTKSDFVGDKVCSYGDIPILSVTTDYDNLFDYETGIYCNGKVWDEFHAANPDKTNSWEVQTNSTQRGREWERECHIDLIESDGSVAISQDCGMRIQGGASRTQLQKSLRFYARSDYGEKSFKYPLFSDAVDEKGKVINKYKTFVVRNGGNDAPMLKFTDNYIQRMVGDMNFTTQHGRGVLVFLDGEYWGVYIMQEDYKEEYYEEHYGVNPDDISMVKCWEPEIGEWDAVNEFIDLCKYAGEKKMTDERYEYICSKLDIDSFADYMATELYISNADWPNNNWAVWRVNTPVGDGANDGRWRFVLYDTEYSTYMYNNVNTSPWSDKIKNACSGNLPSCPINTLFSKLIKYQPFMEKFVKAIEHVSSVCFGDAAYDDFEEQYAYYKPYLDAYQNRFKNSWGRSDRKRQIEQFITTRTNYVLRDLNDCLHLRAIKCTIIVNPVEAEKGQVYLNSHKLDFKANDRIIYQYLNCYDNELTVQANDGYTFAKFVDTVSGKEYFGSENTLSSDDLSASATLDAVFFKNDEIQSGDMNADGKVNLLDVIQLRKKLALFEVGIFETAGDMNNDGRVNLLDLLRLRKKLVGLI